MNYNTIVFFSHLLKLTRKMKTQKIVRRSGHKDYLAVDIVNEKEEIISTPLYLKKNIPVTVKSMDMEENRWVKCELLFDGEKITAKDTDNDSDYTGMEWDVPDEELIDSSIFRY